MSSKPRPASKQGPAPRNEATDQKPRSLPISQLQGTGHRSSYEQARVRTTGVVTAVEARGFYLQEPDDAKARGGSRAIFVFTAGRPKVRPGNKVQVEGTVTEYRPPKKNRDRDRDKDTNLTSTQLVTDREAPPTILEPSVALPEPVELGTAERPLPTGSLYDAGLAYEGLEGMRVRLPDSRVIGPTDKHGEIYIAVTPPRRAPRAPAPLWASLPSLRSVGTALADVIGPVREGPAPLVRSLRASMAAPSPLRQGQRALVRALSALVARLDSTDLPLGPDGTLRAHPKHDYPSRLKVTFEAQLYGPPAPRCDVDDRIGPIDGILFHEHGFYGVKPTHPLQVVRAERKPAVATFAGTDWGLTLASYNVENLDPWKEHPGKVAPGVTPDDDIESGRFKAIARQIVTNLRCPDILALQEIEDNDGAELGNETDASKTWRRLIYDIKEAGGPRYRWVDRRPQAGKEGGRPGGNIRVGFLYNPERVRLDERSVRRVGQGEDAFKGGRKSLTATFEFLPTGTSLCVLNHHWASKHGSTPTYRDPNEPEVIGGEKERWGQSQVIVEHIRQRLAEDADLRLLSVGDFNATEHEAPLINHAADLMFNVGDAIPDYDRYSYIREGLAAALDHQLASRSLRGKVELEYVHINAAFADKASDHDPSLSRIDMR